MTTNTVIANSAPNLVTPATPMAIPSTAVPNTAFQIIFQWDVTQNLSTNNTGSTLQADISYDAGNTWNTNFMIAERPTGLDLFNKYGVTINTASISTSLTPNNNIMTRCRLIATGNINTFIQIIAVSP